MRSDMHQAQQVNLINSAMMAGASGQSVGVAVRSLGANFLQSAAHICISDNARTVPPPRHYKDLLSCLSTSKLSRTLTCCTSYIFLTTEIHENKDGLVLGVSQFGWSFPWIR